MWRFILGLAGGFIGGYYLCWLISKKLVTVAPLPEAEEIAKNIPITMIWQGTRFPLTRHPVHVTPMTGEYPRTTYLMMYGEDTEAVMDVVYDRPAMAWVVEIARMGWGEFEIRGYGRSFTYPLVTQDEVVSPGYVTFKV